MRKQYRQLRKDLVAQGFRLKETDKGHYLVFAPDGRGKALIGSGTGSDHRSLKNDVAELRKIGYES